MLPKGHRVEIVRLRPSALSTVAQHGICRATEGFAIWVPSAHTLGRQCWFRCHRWRLSEAQLPQEELASLLLCPLLNKGAACPTALHSLSGKFLLNSKEEHASTGHQAVPKSRSLRGRIKGIRQSLVTRVAAWKAIINEWINHFWPLNGSRWPPLGIIQKVITSCAPRPRVIRNYSGQMPKWPKESIQPVKESTVTTYLSPFTLEKWEKKTCNRSEARLLLRVSSCSLAKKSSYMLRH